MKHFGKLLIVAILAVCLLSSCVGCAQLLDAAEDKELRGYTETMLDAAVAKDFQAGYTLVEDFCPREDFFALFTALRELFSETDTYELELLAISKDHSFTNGEAVDLVQAAYLVTIDSERYVVNVSTHSSYGYLSSFYISPYESTDYYQTGALGSMEGANALQWVVLFSNLISIAVMVFALVDACRHKIKYKPLWIVIVLLGFVTVGATLGAGQFNFNFNLGWLFTYSALILGGGGTVVFRVLLPVGAIVYLVLRKQLMVKPATVVEAEQPEKEQTPPPVEAEQVKEEPMTPPCEADQATNDIEHSDIQE